MQLLPGLYLPYISPISPRYLPYISPISPLYLPYISPTGSGATSRSSFPAYISPRSPLYLPYRFGRDLAQLLPGLEFVTYVLDADPATLGVAQVRVRVRNPSLTLSLSLSLSLSLTLTLTLTLVAQEFTLAGYRQRSAISADLPLADPQTSPRRDRDSAGDRDSSLGRAEVG